MRKPTKEVTIRIILHILVWTILLALPLYSVKKLRLGDDLLLIYYTFAVINGLIFYANYFLLVPKFFFQKKRYKYYLFVLLLMICFYSVSDISMKHIFSHIQMERRERFERPGDEGRIPPGPLTGLFRRIFTGDPYIIAYLSSASFMIFLSLGFRVLERQSIIEKMQEETEKEKLNAELAFLKNQISPHFFFNTLNNIYSLSTFNPEDSRNAILKLSKMMRYMLYDSEDGDTKLSNEIDLMTNYIELMKLRIEDNYNLKVKFPDKYEDVRIPPLLFIPFIENAFKHGISFREDSFIDIFLDTSDNTLIFRCLNSISGSSAGTGLESSGIGLNNVRKRLALLFPGKYDLHIIKTENNFEVLLKIQMK